MSPADVFPALRSCIKLTSNEIFDVKFYPYPTLDDDQIFAVVSDANVVICRLRLDPESGPAVDILRWLLDEQQPPASLNSLAWTQHPETAKPLVCVAGHTPKHITVLDAESGHPVRALSGHGRGINDLAISPLDPSLLASASEDNTIRLWSLSAAHAAQPCVGLLAGGSAHKAPVLAIHFHPNGRWLLSGGIDTAVCLWPIHPTPSAPPPNLEPTITSSPHFFSTEVHPNYIDCLAFHGDLILSRSARDQHASSPGNDLLLWKISGFDSSAPFPSSPPSSSHPTRSSFPHDLRFRGFQRLLTFSIPYTDRFYHRFNLLRAPGFRPILAMGNQKSTYLFWDLQRLEEEEGYAAAAQGSSAVGDPFRPLEPHARRSVSTALTDAGRHFATSQIAWSPDGKWMLGAGDYGLLAVFHRGLQHRGAGKHGAG